MKVALDKRMTRRAYFEDAATHTRYLAAKARGGLVFLVSTRDQNIGGRLFETGWRTEMAMLAAAVERLGNPGGVFLDIGANIGTTCLPALAHHGFDRSVAIEPAAENVSLLRTNAVLNGLLGRLTIVEAALSDTVGEATLRLHPSNSGAHTLMKRGKPGPVATVRVETVDSLATRGVIDPAELGLVWIDAQGSEPKILSAATSIVGRVPIVLEVQMSKPHEWIADLGYTTAIDLRQGDELPVAYFSKTFTAGGVLDLLFF